MPPCAARAPLHPFRGPPPHQSHQNAFPESAGSFPSRRRTDLNLAKADIGPEDQERSMTAARSSGCNWPCRRRETSQPPSEMETSPREALGCFRSIVEPPPLLGKPRDARNPGFPGPRAAVRSVGNLSGSTSSVLPFFRRADGIPGSPGYNEVIEPRALRGRFHAWSPLYTSWPRHARQRAHCRGQGHLWTARLPARAPGLPGA